MGFYDGTKLLSMKDINGNTPELYLCTSNRSAGKTTYFSRYLVNRFKKYGEKFMLLYRFNYELDSVSDKFFKDIQGLFFQNDKMTDVSKMNGIYHDLLLNDVPCGYALSLNSADQIKKNSHLFSDTCRMLFDEFQSETNHYCNKEIDKFQSVHKSVSRGQGKQSRYVPVIMCGNTVSIINPYYIGLGITNTLQKNTNFLKGDGYVLEQGFNESAALASKESAFERAFKDSNYTLYAGQNVYLNDNSCFIQKISGKSNYICTLKYMGKMYGVRECTDEGFLYVDNTPDPGYTLKVAVTTDDHNVNYVMLKRNSLMISNFRYFFEHGSVRFKNLQCKEAFITAICY